MSAAAPVGLAERAAERRARVRALLGPRGVVLLGAAPPPRAGADTELRYLADSELFYLSGCQEPQSVLVLSGSSEQPACTLFVRGRDPAEELWTGPRPSVAEARAAYGADVAYPGSELAARLPALLEPADQLYYRLGADAALDALVRKELTDARRRRPRSGQGIHTISDPGRLLDELRLRNDADEVARIRAACALTVAAFRDLRDVLRPGAGEWEIEAALEAGFRKRGASGPAFPTIVGSGAHATVLHYSENRSPVQAGELVLVDGGARADMYCADVTRCYSATGRCSPAQRALHDVVRRAHDAGIAAAMPGAEVAGIHAAAVRVLVEGLLDLRLLQGDPAALVADQDSYRRFFPHRTSHWLGLDVHDVGAYVVDGAPRVLEPGMVLTVEPGLYLSVTDPDVPPEFRGIGIRLEDDVLVTASGPEVLTATLPIDPAALFD